MIVTGVAAGCATNGKMNGALELPSLSTGASGVVIPITFKSPAGLVGSEGCTLHVQRAVTLKVEQIAFDPGHDTIFAQLPEGDYSFKELHCGRKWWDLVLHKMPEFKSWAGKIAIAGGLNLKVGDSQRLSIHWSNRAANREETLKILGRLPASFKNQVVSAYTGTPIHQDDVAAPINWKEWDVTGEKQKSAKKDAQWPDFRSCYQGESRINGLWLGGIKLLVDYKKSEMVNLSVEPTWNTFSSHYLDCAKAVLRDFHPKAAGELHYTILL
jgi:hypothetical protein